MAPRRLDHAVHAVDDLDAAASGYAELGFTVTPRADHPFGTSNRLVVLDGSYVELVTVTRPDAVPPSGFAADVAARLAGPGPGIAFLVLGSDDARTDRDGLAGDGLAEGEVFSFSRPAPLPDGSSREAAFDLVLTPGVQGLGVFLCHHRTPESVWHPSATAHPNRAGRMVEVRLPLALTLHERISLARVAGSAWGDERLPLDGTTIVAGTERPEIWIRGGSDVGAVVAGVAVRLFGP